MQHQQLCNKGEEWLEYFSRFEGDESLPLVFLLLRAGEVAPDKVQQVLLDDFRDVPMKMEQTLFQPDPQGYYLTKMMKNTKTSFCYQTLLNNCFGSSKHWEATCHLCWVSKPRIRNSAFSQRRPFDLAVMGVQSHLHRDIPKNTGWNLLNSVGGNLPQPWEQKKEWQRFVTFKTLSSCCSTQVIPHLNSKQ